MHRAISTTVVATALRAGRAELLGNKLGDPVYYAGAFWHVSANAVSYELVIGPARVAVCADALRRLRIARATPSGVR